MLTSTNAHTGPRPKPQCYCVRILREQTKPAISLPLPLSPAQSIVPRHNMRMPQPVRHAHLNVNEKKRSEAQNERPALPQENGRRQTAVSRRLTLICLQVEPRTRST